MKLIQHFSGCLLVLSLSACGSFWGIGESNLSCDAEKGMGCTGIRAAYMATDSYSPEVDARNHWVRKSQSSDSYSRGKASEYGYATRGVADFVPVSSIVPFRTGQGQVVKPLRQPEQVMRVWVNTHQDEDGNLVYPSHTFTQVREPQWAVGTPYQVPKTKTILPPRTTTVAVSPAAEKAVSDAFGESEETASEQQAEQQSEQKIQD